MKADEYSANSMVIGLMTLAMAMATTRS